MNRLVRYGRALAELAGDYVESSRARGTSGLDPGSVRSYVMFIGYPRSGHSLIGALLDAHPDAVVAHELGALRHVHARFDRERLFHLLAENARRSAERRRPSSGYSYRVPGQWQGRWRRLLVIGDKQAEGATLRLQQRPELLDRLWETVRVPVRVLHVVRNPFDNIATIVRRAAPDGEPCLETATRRYFDLAETVETLKPTLGSDLYDVRHEALVRRPAETLEALCRWLGLDPEPEYLTACAGIVFERAHQSRMDVTWSEAERSRVEAGIARHTQLAGYGFET